MNLIIVFLFSCQLYFRVKTEIKTEYNEFDESGGFIAKRIKFES